ncbi:unnamed protein product [Trichobilharzia regenti]|nr:unnamed protein product [Trichobilharzia regenti]
MTTTKSGYGPDGNSSGHFIGYSMAGLPLFTAGQTPTHGSALLANPEEVGLWYHLRETFHGILTGKASRRIFAFLCLNLVDMRNPPITWFKVKRKLSYRIMPIDVILMLCGEG